jgi:nucleotide-binding universal stress UspA family protein
MLRSLEKLPNARAVVRYGEPVAEIVAEADECGANLIVMGTHGRGRVSQLVLGSTAEGVVRMAPCPVMTIRQSARRKMFQKILVAVDASESAVAGLHLALELAHRAGGPVGVVHVANTVYPWLPPMTEIGVAPLHEVRRYGQVLLKRILADMPGSERCEVMLRDGDPAKEILKAAQLWKADLLIVGSGGYTHFQQFVLGSVANAVMRGACCPVLTVRAEAMRVKARVVQQTSALASTGKN